MPTAISRDLRDSGTLLMIQSRHSLNEEIKQTGTLLRRETTDISQSITLHLEVTQEAASSTTAPTVPTTTTTGTTASSTLLEVRRI